jgi:hypothetical protein
MAARGLRITALVGGSLLLMLILALTALRIRPDWVARPAENYLRNYLSINPLSDSASIDFERIEWVPWRGIRVHGLHVHRKAEGVYVRSVRFDGLGWSNGGPSVGTLVLDSLVVTGTPSGAWMHWFDAWVDPNDTVSAPIYASVDQVEVDFWMRSVEGDTLLAPSQLSLSGIRVAASELSVSGDLNVAVPGTGEVAAAFAIRPEESNVVLSYQRWQLAAHYTPLSVQLKIEDDSINSIEFNILNENDSWMLKPTHVAWDGVEGSVAALWGPSKHWLELEWSGINAHVQERDGRWSLAVRADSTRADSDAPWAAHGGLRGSYADGNWTLNGRTLHLRVADSRWVVGPIRASGGATSWELNLAEQTYGQISARGDYRAESVTATWMPVRALQPIATLPSVAALDLKWSSLAPWDLQLTARDTAGVVGGATASYRSELWSIAGSLGGYRVNAEFNRTPDRWSVPTQEVHQWAENVVSNQLGVLDSVGLKSLSINGPELNASIIHRLGQTTASVLVSQDETTASWRYAASESKAEHFFDWTGSEEVHLHLVGHPRDSLRVTAQATAPHSRGGTAEFAMSVWPHQSVWSGSLNSGSASAWYRPDEGDSLALTGILSGAQSWTYDFANQRLALDDPLSWKSPEGSIAVGGALSPNEGEVLRVQARNVNLPFWSRIAGLSGVDLGGALRLDAVVVGQLSGWAVSGGIRTENLSLRNQSVGEVSVELDYIPDAAHTDLSVVWNHRDTVLLDLRGVLDADHFAAQTKVLNIPVRWVRPFAEGAVDELDGRLKGKVNLESKPDFSDFNWYGSGFWANANLKLPSIGLGLKSSTPWTLTKSGVVLGPARWADHRGVGSAEIRANVAFEGHDLVDLTFKTERMLVLDLPPNPDFYGYVVGSGQGRLRGTANALRLDIQAKSADSSVFVLPLDAPVSLDEVEFLHFKSRSAPDAPRTRLRRTDDFRFDLHLDLEVTPDVLARLILDETVGDVIETRGAGPLQLDVPWVGDMALRGNLVLNRGTYLFTLQNLINKPFSLLPGGTINWTGDPYGAQMDLTAVYKTRADVRDYLSLPEAGRQNVDVQMHATGPLFQPQLAFGIRLPNAGELAQAALSSRLSYPDERTTQVLSLLTISSFWVGSSPLAAQGMQAVESNTSQVLASQFTNFVTQGLGADWDVNLAYSTNTAAAQREMEASIGRSFLDDRLSIQTEWGIPIGQSQPSIGFGDVEVRYQLSDDGRWSAKAYQRRNDQNMQSGVVGSQRQGVGLRWEQSGTSWSDLLRRRN